MADLLLRGFSVSQVVHTYGDVCQAITELSLEMDAPIGAADFRTLNQCLDEAIAGAVTEYGREREQSHADVANTRSDERMGFLVAELRLAEDIQNSERIVMSVLIDEIAAAASLEARAKGIQLTVLPVEAGLVVEADRQVLTAVLGNLLQNAVKFTRPATSVTLRVRASAERVLLEVEDECGGLPGDAADDLFYAFAHRSTDRTGLGLGLAFSRWGVEANHGRIYARSLPTHGCIFTVDLPRLFVPAAATA